MTKSRLVLAALFLVAGVAKAADEAPKAGLVSTLKQLAQFASKSTDGYGVGLSSTVLVGAGLDVKLGAYKHDGKIGIFCTPGLTVQSNIGVDGGVDVIKTLGCATNEQYAGPSIGFQVGGAATMQGIPLSGNASYGIGIDSDALFEALKEESAAHRLDLAVMASEIADIAKTLAGPAGPLVRAQAESVRFTLLMALRIANSVVKDPEVGKLIEKTIKNLAAPKVGKNLRKSMEAMDRSMGAELARRYPNLASFFGALRKGMNGCDSVSANASVSFGLSPVTLASTISTDSMIAEFSASDLSLMNVAAAGSGAEAVMQFVSGGHWHVPGGQAAQARVRRVGSELMKLTDFRHLREVCATGPLSTLKDFGETVKAMVHDTATSPEAAPAVTPAVPEHPEG